MAIVVLASIVGGCVSSEAPEMAAVRTVTRTVVKKVPVATPAVACPTNDQLRDAAIEVSKTTYRNALGGSRTCACPDDTYEHMGVRRSCSAPGAVKPSDWAMCSRDQVPQAVVDRMKAKLPPCR